MSQPSAEVIARREKLIQQVARNPDIQVFTLQCPHCRNIFQAGAMQLEDFFYEKEETDEKATVIL